MIKCDLCDATVESVEAAIEAGWFPSYWIGEDEGCPICEDCAASKCHYDRTCGLVLTEAKVFA